jgi:ribonuclease P/MRP protein subunit RPP40
MDEWIRSWLSGRKQSVVLNGKFSSWLEVLSGVPQGSVLGPLLFVIFINDMDNTVEHLTSILRKFADDTKLGKKVRTDKERQELQEALEKLCHWADRWGMEFNVSKCKAMHMGHANQKHDYYMNDQQLEKSEEERDIGVMITSN